ncbi:MAG: hypothetical protein HOE48_07750 [Candidatus Latescibacteria bacterium]|jgi:hypothetical protein|nr:hypothetical protein [Candidatus Latescibacterota bacterium]MBT4137792.1 hypothetical protein [Candidatus Latescibacterota bacterium]MBT5830134.1 hypothetical protein [Candidatus Latescibacterota bacterium]
MEHTQHNTEVLQSMNNPKREERARSLLDLIELKMFDLELAAWFASVVSKGASFITGSGPGGIGKTTTMRSFLSFVPQNLRFDIALPDEITELGQVSSCIISHELSDHPPATYLWDQDLRDFFAHTDNGHVMVGNVHADDLAEIQKEIVSDCNVPEEQFRKINIFAFICLEGGNPEGRVKDTTTRRIVNRVFYSDGESAHKLVYTDADGFTSAAPRDAESEAKCRAFLEESLKGSERTLEGVRELFLS